MAEKLFHFEKKKRCLTAGASSRFHFSPYCSFLLLLLNNEGSIFISLTITDLQMGQMGLSSKEKFSLIQQEQLVVEQLHTAVSSSGTCSMFFFEKYKPNSSLEFAQANLHRKHHPTFR
jgi:hypothetical protein